ncbi:hypothetical protein BD770DRAFT_329480 [Pilaira anomala]|nr:hypothetical protein BD770DRAFT_329480 [Pilaira anomala]
MYYKIIGEVRIVNDEEEVKLTLKKAEQSHWCRCPKCTRLIEKVSGCSTIRCICGIHFCYRCGGISDNHYCRNRCQELNQESLMAIRSSMFVPITKKPSSLK